MIFKVSSNPNHSMILFSGETLNPLKCYCAVCSWLKPVTQVRRSMGMHINTSVCCLERAVRCLERAMMYPVHKAGCQGSLASGDRRSRVHVQRLSRKEWKTSRKLQTVRQQGAYRKESS